MESLAIRCGGSCSLTRIFEKPPSKLRLFSDARPRSSTVLNRPAMRTRGRCAVTMSMSSLPTLTSTTQKPDFLSHLELNGNRNGFRDERMTHAKIDEWMRDSVVEIVKNLQQAPLLVQVFSKDEGATTLKTEGAVASNWPKAMGRWTNGEAPMPEGVIFVGELTDKKSIEEGESFCGESDARTRAWGIVIQGRQSDYGPACYLLKTCTVKSVLGLLCTHYCLVRVKSFRESTMSQLTNCWLL